MKAKTIRLTDRIDLLLAWYDLWIGAFYDTKKKYWYILPFPCVGIVIKPSPKPN